MIPEGQGQAQAGQPAASTRVLVVLSAAVVALALYSLARYGVLWGEVDTYAFTGYIDSMLRTGRLVPANGAYPHGYGYPSLGVVLSQVTGLSLPALQLIAAPLLMVWLVIPAWLLFRELTGSHRGAALATVILFVQPEFLFPLLRGTHEKFTRGLMLLCLYLLLRSLRSRRGLSQFAAFVLAFYLSIYALITFNNLMATSFIVALGLAMVLSWIVLRATAATVASAEAATRRLMYIVLSSLAIAFVFTFYAYPPAQQNVRVLGEMGDRLAALLLQIEQVRASPYDVVAGAWVSLPVYFAVSLANWLLLAGSAVLWLVHTVRWLQKREQPDVSGLLLWAFYAAFAFQAAASIAVDVSGTLSSNLQHRIFPSFAMLAAPLVARWLVEWQPRRAWAGRVVWAGGGAVIALLAILSIFKATNEPLVSNKWLFHRPGEMQALRWAEGALVGHTLWTDYDERLTTAYGIRTVGVPASIRLDAYAAESGTRDRLVSEVTRLRSVRLGEPLPIEADSLRTYDNGQAQIYHLRPRTQYQR